MTSTTGAQNPFDPAAADFEPDGDFQEERLLGFYDRLRRRVTSAVPSGRLAQGAADALLLVPDVFVLLTRLALDRDVPASSRSLIGGALAYFLLPVDLLPEAMLGGFGFLDDVVLASAVLTHVLSDELEPLAQQYWSGSGKARVVLRDIARAAHSLLGDRIFGRLKALLGRRGVRI